MYGLIATFELMDDPGNEQEVGPLTLKQAQALHASYEPFLLWWSLTDKDGEEVDLWD